jgi:tetratricopeptide (TPR) repeat protein/CHAT domain-containing protein
MLHQTNAYETVQALQLLLCYRDLYDANMDDNSGLSTLLLHNFEAILQALPDHDQNTRGQLYSYYANLIFRRFLRRGQLQDLEEAITKARWALERTGADDEAYAGRANNLGVMLGRLYQRLGRMEDLEEAIQMSRQVIEATPEDHLDLAGSLNNLGIMLQSRYERMGRMEDLEEAIEVARQAIEPKHGDHPDLASWLSSLGNKLERRYERTGKMEDLEEAVGVAHQAVQAISEDHPDLAGSLNNLGTKLERRYERTGNMEDLNEAIGVTRQAVKATPEDHPDLAAWLNNLGTKLESRYKRTGKMDDLEEAIEMSRQAVQATPKDHLHLAKRLGNLGSKLESRYERTGKIEDLDEAIGVTRQAVKAIPEHHSDLAALLSNLGNKLGQRHERTGNMEDLDEAIGISRQAVKATPEDHSNLAGCLSNLGIKLGQQYDRTGKMEDLEEAIGVSRQAVEATPEAHPGLGRRLNNFGNMLQTRYERVGRMEDLEEAIGVSRQAVEATPEDHPDLAAWLSNLGSKLGQRYERKGSVEDLDEAIGVSRQAVGAIPEDHPELAGSLNTLGIMLESRYERTRNMEDLKEAIGVARQVVKATPDDHPDLAGWLNNLGNKLESEYERTGTREVLEEAIGVSRQAVEITPADHPGLALTLINLGRHSLFLDSSRELEALKLFLQAWNCSNAPPLVRIRAATVSLQLLQEQKNYSSAYELSIEAIDLLPRVHNRSLSLQDQQYVVSLFSGLATDACSLALQTGEPPAKAVELLERGRGVILSLLMDDWNDLAKLKAAHPTLYAQHESLRVEVNKPISSVADRHTQQSALKRRYDAGIEIDKLIMEIRKQPGFEDFLLSPRRAELQDAASDGPIIVINVSNHRCDAILIEQHQIRSLALPNLNSKEIKDKARRDDLGSYEVLEWLWDALANPILDALGLTRPASGDDLPHIWWIPTGALSKFPLHAAGCHNKGPPETALDRVMSSYSSSVKAIIQSRRYPSTSSISAQALLVAMEHTPGNSKLPFATKEVAMLHGLCKSMASHPIEPGRRKQDVISYLPQCQIFHFAGHGYTDNDDPLKSHLLLEDGKSDPLTVATLLKMNLRERPPFLAYLSACGTGQIKDERFADESIHLISACQLAGFRHVIGTLWEVNDALCVDMTRITYEGMRDGGMTDKSVCLGLHNATISLRDRWLSMSAKARHEGRLVRNIDVPLTEDETSASSADQRDDRLPRDVVLCDDDADVGKAPFHWVPYVHFGV